MRTARLMIVAAIAAAASPSAAVAYDWSGAGIGIGGLYRTLDYPTELRVPYFASRPPVYYSQPVPRTYGYSPFAYSPDTRTPDVVPVVQPLQIVNPYVTPTSASSPAASPDASPTAAPSATAPRARTISTGQREGAPEPAGPLMILNPFVVGGEV